MKLKSGVGSFVVVWFGGEFRFIENEIDSVIT